MKLLTLLSTISAVAAVLLPAPNGPYPVSVTVRALTDQSRIDPYAPKDQRHKRQVLVSMFLPIDSKQTSSKKSRIPYMTPAVAEDYGAQAAAAGLPPTIFAGFEVETSVVTKPGASCGSKKESSKKIPLVLFSPGGGNSRLLYGMMARSLASEGYAVVTIDHPYDASVVEFPDGKIVRSANISDEDIAALTKLTQVRAEDASFVLDQVMDPKTFSKELAAHNMAIDFKRILMYGHSQGGATAALAMLSDSRIKSGVNLDGRFFGSVMNKGLSRPFVLLGRPDHSAEDNTWPQVFPKLRGSRFEMEVANSTHSSFTDLPALLDSLDLPAPAKEATAKMFGAASGKQMDKVIKGVMMGFSKLVFRELPAPAVLKKGQKEISGLTVLRSDIRK